MGVTASSLFRRPRSTTATRGGTTVNSCNSTVLVTDPGSVLSNAYAMEVAFDGTATADCHQRAKVVSSFGG